MSNFMESIKDTMLNGANNISITENGATGYRTSGKALLDINFAAASLRQAEPDEIADRFMRAFFEDKVTAMKWLFFARDVRGGLGERRLFRSVMQHMAQSNPEYIIPLLDLIPVYGRYDDLWCLLDTDLAGNVLDLIKTQLAADIEAAQNGRNISLLAKWLPSPNASSPHTKQYAKIILRRLGMTERAYRKTLSKLRKKLDVVECKMSARNWDKIKYETVPSCANIIYSNAFLRNDEQRRRAFLDSLEKGETKINASVLYPHDIVHQYTNTDQWDTMLNPLDQTLEVLWNALPDTVQDHGNTIVVADGSGSMTSHVGGSNTSALDVANALAIYFAERSSGQFKDNYITFSERPQLVDLSQGKNLREKIQIALQHSEIADTNIEAVFDLILSTAGSHNMTQADLPQNILIISDMEFNHCACCGSADIWHDRPDAKLFQVIADRYTAAGYKMPRLVFWNVNSRTGTIPVMENELGVALVSGFSTNIVKMVMSGNTDPYECLLEMLNSDRYAPIGDALRHIAG